MASLFAINSGILHREQTFWHAVEQISSLYYTLTATSGKVLQELVASNPVKVGFSVIYKFYWQCESSKGRKVFEIHNWKLGYPVRRNNSCL